MDRFLASLFYVQIADQCAMAETGASLLTSITSSADVDRVWLGAQIFLTGSGNVAKAAFGSGGKGHASRALLRAELGIRDDSPLRDVAMRNHFEHFDERLERWWENSESHNHLDRMIGHPSMIAGLAEGDRFRVFDPASMTLFFWGETFDVAAVLAELVRVRPRALALRARS